MTPDPTPTKPMRERLAIALHEAATLAMEGGMHTYEIIEVMEAEIATLRQPFQNPEDDVPK